MSLGYCIPDLIAAGKVPAQYVDDLRQRYDELLEGYVSQGMDRAAAEALATQQAVTAWEAGIKQARRERLLMLNKQSTILHQARTGYRGANPDGPVRGDALAAHLAWDRRAGYANVEYTIKEVSQTALGHIYGLLEKFRADLAGRVRNKAELTDVVRELHGQKTGNLSAQELADAWRQGAEYLRQRRNTAGGATGKQDDWGLPHAHDPLRVGSVSPEAWIDEVLPQLDRARMIDRDTLQPMGEAKLRTVLRGVYDNIVSEGWVGRQPGAAGAGMLANRRADPRVLHFKDADAWLAYNERYGRADPFDAMMAHVHGMARDIGMMEVLGPNPAATIRWMKEVAEQEAAIKGTITDRQAANKAAASIDRLWSVLNGSANRPVSETMAQVGAAARNWQVATKLGSAVISSMSDLATASLTRHFNGLSSMTQLPDMIRLLNPIDDAARQTVRRHGIISDELLGRVSQIGRTQLDDLSGGRLAGGLPMRQKMAARANEVTRRVADGVLRASGLNAWTIAGREAMGKEFAATFAEHAAKGWSALDPALRGFFERYGLGESAWDAIRATTPDKSGGFDAIWPNMIGDEQVGRRLMQGMLTEIDFAIPTGGIRQKAFLAGIRPGTVMGELARTGFQFKMFPMTVMTMHVMRMVDQPGAWSKARYGALFLGGTTLMGALAYQLAQLTKGQDPEPMMDEKGNPSATFWWKALLKGGGLGVFGDLINMTFTNSYGQTIGDIVKGPGWGTAVELTRFAYGTTHKQADGTEVTEHDFARLLERETPGGSLWYVRAAYQRILLDSLKEMQGQSYADSYDRMERRARDNGTGYWWRPGERQPGRAPNLGNALAAPPPENAAGIDGTGP